MKKFKYFRPDNISHAEILMSGLNGSTRILAGGTDLIGVLREKILPQEVQKVISLKGIPELQEIKDEGEYLQIGAMATLSEIISHPSVAQYYPALAKAAQSVASPQIRNMATIGGNICQEPRCWYYRYPGNKYNCIRKGGIVCNAMTGKNEYHSIFGVSKVCQTSCEINCPNNTNIPAYMEMIRNGNIEEAASLLYSVNPLAAATGRVCPHKCETQCNRGMFDENVSIRDVERYLGDYTLDHLEDFVSKSGKDSGKKVAIIGAGPVGLVAAFFLIQFGHKVTIIDENEKAGGMLYYGIPSYRLPKDILEKYQTVLVNNGVEFRMNTKVGHDISFEEIRNESDAVLVAIGAWNSQKLGCQGEDGGHVIGGITFLNTVACHEEQNLGQNVIVIGGGNTAMDACRTAKRLGVENVYSIYRRTREEMPADQEEVEQAAEEGVIFKTLVNPIEIIKDATGNVKQVKLQRMVLGEPDEGGRKKPIPVEGDFEIIDVDTVIIAVGQEINLNGFEGLSSNSKNMILVDEDYRTNESGVYAAGDSVFGPRTAVEAIYGARMAVQKICETLNPNDAVAEINLASEIRFGENVLENLERVKPVQLRVEDRRLMTEDEETIKDQDVQHEAGRCFNCGCVAVSPSDIATAIVALGADVVTTKRIIPADRFFYTNIGSSTILMQDEFVIQVRVPKPDLRNAQIYEKYRTRKTIDFPILSIAISTELDRGLVKKARIAFGAVAPIPVRMYEVERFLEGKKLTPKVAEEASALAVRDCLALAENAYKINLIKVLFRRNLLKFASR